MNPKQFQQRFEAIVANVNTVIHGKDDVVRMALVAVCADGHILFEDVPGVGKSMMARALAVSMGADVNRIQCTPDMLPGDITGSTIIEPRTMKFAFRPGPVFTNILLVDEINRATPKTQSALLEAMAERNVSIEGTTHPLPDPFLVLATQNPVELAGTFPLPEAQLDRFLFKLRMGYPGGDAEKLVIRGNSRGLEVEKIGPVTSPREVIAMQDFAAKVVIPDAVEQYIVDIVTATRTDANLTLGASPRASITLAKASRVMAAADGRDSVFPEDVKVLLRPVLGHRLILTPDAQLRGETVDDLLERLVIRIKPPMGAAGPAPKRPRTDTGSGDSTGGNGVARARRPARRATTK